LALGQKVERVFAHFVQSALTSLVTAAAKFRKFPQCRRGVLRNIRLPALFSIFGGNGRELLLWKLYCGAAKNVFGEKDERAVGKKLRQTSPDFFAPFNSSAQKLPGLLVPSTAFRQA